MDGIYLSVEARIRFRDGTGGTLHKVVVDPATKQITDLVVVQGFLQKRDYVLPVSLVEQVLNDEIVVAVGLDELPNYPAYQEAEVQEHLDDWEHGTPTRREHVVFWQPLTGMVDAPTETVPVIRHRVALGIPGGAQVIGSSTPVHNVDGLVGNIDHLCIREEKWEITHLIVRCGIVPHYVVIPFSWVERITPERLLIQGRDKRLREVPPARVPMELYFAPDAEGEERHALDEALVIAEEIHQALAEEPTIDSSQIEVVYDQGVVTLSGVVESAVAHKAAEEIARRHTRVVSVVNALETYPPEPTAVQIADRLKSIARTSRLG